MGFVREERVTRILERLFKGLAQNGTVPTLDIMQSTLERAQILYGDFVNSAMTLTAFPKRFGESSALSFNRILNALEDDCLILIRSIKRITDLNIDNLSEWVTRSTNLDRRINSLKSRIDSLLLTASDSAGYVAFIDEPFRTLENVHSSSTVNVDTDTGEVSIGVINVSTDDGSSGTLLNLDDGSKVSFRFLSTSRVRYIDEPSGSDLSNILSPDWSSWIGEATSASGGEGVTLEIKIELSTPFVLNRIKVSLTASAIGAGFVSSLQCSTDGYSWFRPENCLPIIGSDGIFNFRFSPTNCSWIKFVLSKNTTDADRVGERSSFFGIRSVQAYRESFNVSEEGALLLTEILFPRAAGTNVLFSRALLETCTLPSPLLEGQSIDFEVKAYSGINSTDWIKVLPARTNGDLSSVIDFSSPQKIQSNNLETIWRTDINVESLNLTRLSGIIPLEYEFSSQWETLTNFYFDQSSDNLGSLILARNIGYPEGKYPTVTINLLVEEGECGWKRLGTTGYSCEFYVGDPMGKNLELGPTVARIDRVLVSDRAFVSQGWHIFQTTSASWRTIDSSISSEVPSSAESLRRVDPFYPNNHKYLIEGWQYPESWTDEKVYRGVDLYCAKRLEQVSLQSFWSQIGNLEIFTLDDFDNKTLILLNYDPAYANFVNERERLLGYITVPEYDSIQLRGFFRSEDPNLSPILNHYRIKVK